MVATAVITIVVLIFGEVSPKSMAKEAPEQFAMFSAPIIGTLMVILTPVNWFFAMLKKGLSKIMRSKDKEGITEEELVTAALLMQYGIVLGNDPFLYGEKIKALLQKGARPLPAFSQYPNASVGWGALCVRNSLPQ